MGYEPETGAAVKDKSEQLQQVDDAAGAASRGWVSALGLFSAIDGFRFGDASQPIPAPGLEDLREEAAAHALDAVAAAHAGWIVDNERSDETGSADALLRAVQRAEDARDGVNCCVRRLAQLALGVAQPALAADDTELIERAAIAILTDPENELAAAKDDLTLFSRYPSELEVEFAGVFARMLVDCGGTLVLAGPSMPDILIHVASSTGTLEFTIPAPERTERLARLGWTELADGSVAARWDGPIMLVTPAKLLAATITDCFDVTPAELTLLPREARTSARRRAVLRSSHG